MSTRCRVSPGNSAFKSYARVIHAVLIWLFMTALPSSASPVTWVVDDDGVQCPTRDFASIQTAILVASSGDTITVCQGVYAGNHVLNKDLTLNGAQAGVDARGRITPVESIIFSPAGTLLTLVSGSAGSTIDGFFFLGGARSIESTSGPITGVEILNNRMVAFSGNAIFLNDPGTDISINQNDIDGASKLTPGGLVHLDTDNFDGLWFMNNRVANGQAATGFFVDGNRNVDKSTPGVRQPRFTGNLIERNLTGVNLGSRAWGDGPISGNTIRNNLSDGLQGGPRDSLIDDNWFDNNGRDGLALTSFGSVDPLRGAQHNTIERNCFTRNGFASAGAGIFFSSTQAPNTISTNHANENNIVGNAIGVEYPGAETVDAELNWWGSPTGPTHAGNPGGMGDAVVDDGDGVDYYPWRTTAVAGTPCSVGPATDLTLEPETATNPVDTEHCVTATVTNMFGIPQQGVTVRFAVMGSVNTSGSATTDANGEAQFCYTGPAFPGADTITAFADADDDNMQDPTEPFDTASKTWILPVTTPGCEVTITNGGWIIAMNGDRGSFGGNAKSDADGNVSGQEQYQDHGPVQPFNLHGTPVVITCTDDTTQATIFGEATIDGMGSHTFRIDVRDIAEPGKGIDRYRIQVEAYDSGDQTLQGGNVQIKRAE
jgi:hypothetical protein